MQICSVKKTIILCDKARGYTSKPPTSLYLRPDLNRYEGEIN